MAWHKNPRVRGKYIVTIGSGGTFANIPAFLAGMKCNIQVGTTQVLGIRDLNGTFSIGNVVEGQTTLTRGTIKHVTSSQMLLTGVGNGKGVFLPGETLIIYGGGGTPSCTTRDAGRLATIRGVMLQGNELVGNLTIAATDWTVGSAGDEPPAEVEIVPANGVQCGPTYANLRIAGTLTINLPYLRFEGFAISDPDGAVIIDTDAAGGGRVLLGSCNIPATGAESGSKHGVVVVDGSTAYIWGCGISGWSGSGIYVEEGATAHCYHNTLVKNKAYGIADIGTCYARANLFYQNIVGAFSGTPDIDAENVIIVDGDSTDYGFSLGGADPRNWNIGYDSSIHAIVPDAKKVYMKATQIEEDADSGDLYHARDIRWRAKPMAAPNRAMVGPADIGADDYHVALNYDNCSTDLDEWDRAYGYLPVFAYGSDRKYRLPGDHEFPRSAISIRTPDTHVSLGGHKVTHGQWSAGVQKDTARTFGPLRFHFPRPSYWDTVEEELFVAMPTAKRIYCIDTATEPADYRHKWEIGASIDDVGLRNPWGVTGDATYLYIADFGQGAVYRVYRTGAQRGQLTTANHTWSGTGSGGAVKPVGIHLYGGYLFVADHLQSRIHVLSASTLAYVTSFGTKARAGGANTFDNPISMVGRVGRLYVTDMGSRDGYGDESGHRAIVLSVAGSVVTWVSATNRSQGQMMGCWGNGTNLFVVTWQGVGGSEVTRIRKFTEADGVYVTYYSVAGVDANVRPSCGTGIVGDGTDIWIGQYNRSWNYDWRECISLLDVSSACSTVMDLGTLGPGGAGVFAATFSAGGWPQAHISDVPSTCFASSTPSDVSVYDGEIELHPNGPGWQFSVYFQASGACHDIAWSATADYDLGFFSYSPNVRLERLSMTTESHCYFPDESRREQHYGQIQMLPSSPPDGLIIWKDIEIDGGSFTLAKIDYQSSPSNPVPGIRIFDIDRIFVVCNSETLERRPIAGETERDYGYTQVNAFALYVDCLGTIKNLELAGLSGGGLSCRPVTDGTQTLEVRRIRDVFRGRPYTYAWQVHGPEVYDCLGDVDWQDWFTFGMQTSDESHNRGVCGFTLGPMPTTGVVALADGSAEAYPEQAQAHGACLRLWRGSSNVSVSSCAFKGSRGLIRMSAESGSSGSPILVDACTFEKTETDGDTIYFDYMNPSTDLRVDFTDCEWIDHADPQDFEADVAQGTATVRHYQTIHVTVLNGASPVDGATVTFSSATSDGGLDAFPSDVTDVNGEYSPLVHTQIMRKLASQAPTFIDRDVITCYATKGGVGSGSAAVPVTRLGGVIEVEVNLATMPSPIVTGVSPASGSIAGGQTGVEIFGLWFATDCTVTMGGTSATVTARTSTKVTVTTPAHAAGLVDVIVTNPTIGSGTLTGGYEFMNIAADFVDQFLTGTLGGNWQKVLIGTGEMDDWLAAGGGDADGAWQPSPAYPASGDGAIVRYVGGSVPNNQSIEVKIDRRVDNSVRADAFVRTVGATYGVDFGGYNAAFTMAGAGGSALVYLYKCTVGGAFAYEDFFALSDVPTTGVIRLVLAVVGTDITWTVYYGTSGTPAGTKTHSDASLASGTPGWGYAGGGGMKDDRQDFDMVTIPGLGDTTVPNISGISVAVGPIGGGTSVTITGTGFGATQGIGYVNFGAAAAASYTSWSNTSIVCVTAAHAAGIVDIKVAHNNTFYDLLRSSFEFLAAPTVVSCFPNTGTPSGGTPVSIGGTNFKTGATVAIGGNSATSVVVVNTYTITCVTPAHAAGAVNVVVTNPDTQTGTLVSGFTYVAGAAAPVIVSVAPNEGTAAGGTPITIIGTGFNAEAIVLIDTIPAENVIVVGPTEITCDTPEGEDIGAVLVVVMNPDFQWDSIEFTYISEPTVSSVSPAIGTLAGGTPITIYGSEFFPGATATFDGLDVAEASYQSRTQMTGKTPAHAIGKVTVEVTNTDAGYDDLAEGYEYADITIDPLPPTGHVFSETRSPMSGRASAPFLLNRSAVFGQQGFPKSKGGKLGGGRKRKHE